MGGERFYVISEGRDAQTAFQKVVDQALYDHGHSGYSGTIAEKDEFEMKELPKGIEDIEEYASDIGRDNDKWGPAFCFDLGDGKYAFFGWASS